MLEFNRRYLAWGDFLKAVKLLSKASFKALVSDTPLRCWQMNWKSKEKSSTWLTDRSISKRKALTKLLWNNLLPGWNLLLLRQDVLMRWKFQRWNQRNTLVSASCIDELENIHFLRYIYKDTCNYERIMILWKRRNCWPLPRLWLQLLSSCPVVFNVRVQESHTDLYMTTWLFRRSISWFGFQTSWVEALGGQLSCWRSSSVWF